MLAYQPKSALTGSGLLQALIFFAMISAFALVAADRAMLVGKSNSYARGLTDYYALVAYLEATLTSNQNCLVAFGVNSGLTNASNQPLGVNGLPGPTNSTATDVKIYSPNGEVLSQLGTTYGTMKVQVLNLVLFGVNSKPVPGTNDFVYPAQLQIEVGRADGSLGARTLIKTFDFQARIDSSKNLVGCSNITIKGTRQTTSNSPPCDITQAPSVGPSGDSISCQEVFCQTGKLGVWDSNGNPSCSDSSTCNGSGYGFVSVNSKYQCKRLVCPLNQYPTRMDPEGYPLTCDRTPLIDCIAQPGACIVSPTFSQTVTYVCPTPLLPGQICDPSNCPPTSTKPYCYLINNLHTTQDCTNAGGTVALSPPSSSGLAEGFYCKFSGANCPLSWSYSGTESLPNGQTAYTIPPASAVLNTGGVVCCDGLWKVGSCDSYTIRSDSECLNNLGTAVRSYTPSVSGSFYHYTGKTYSYSFNTISSNVPLSVEYPTVQYCKLCSGQYPFQPQNPPCPPPRSTWTACDNRSMSCYSTGGDTCSYYYTEDTSTMSYTNTTYCY